MITKEAAEALLERAEQLKETHDDVANSNYLDGVIETLGYILGFYGDPLEDF